MLSSGKKKILQGSAVNMLQMLLSFGVSIIVPPFLVHHMAQAEYSAWILILQISAYINYLEFGLQTAIGKFVAEYHATGDTAMSAKVASTAISILSIAAAIGIAAMAVLALQVPAIFHQMPSDIVPAVRVGILAIGSTTALLLPFSVLQAIFIGLQRYTVPGVVTSVGRIASSIAIVLLVVRHGTLAEIALLIAGFNLLTALAQWYCWRRYARDAVAITLFVMDRAVAARLVEYCGTLSIWTLGGLFVSGLDTTIVGRYDFRNTGFYGVAGSATNFMLMIIGNLIGPLMPAISSVHGQRTPTQLGVLLIRMTRYCTLLVTGLALPLLIGGFPLLRLWLGRTYAEGSVLFLAVLVLANALRQLFYPYAIMMVATGTQRAATVAPVLEACVNLGASLVLVRSYGAIGVAYGTLIGAIVGTITHLLLSMRLTLPVIRINRLRFVLQSVLRPASCAVPALLLLPWWHGRTMLPFSPPLLGLWIVATLSLVWLIGFTATERAQTTARVRALL